MEPPDAFLSTYSQTLSKGISHFAKIPYTFWACKTFFLKHHPQASEHDFIKFHELILLNGKQDADLIYYYYTIGCFKELKEIADKHHYTEISRICTLRLGNFDRIEELEKPPSSDCHIAELSNWLKYHCVRRTLHKATKNYTHDKKDGNALVYLYRGNTEKALALFTGDLLEGNEELLFKAFCHISLGHPFEEVSACFKHAIRSRAVISSVFESFHLLLSLSHSQKPESFDQIHSGTKFPSLELMYVGSESGVRNPAHCSYLNILAKEHPNPYIRVFNLIITAKKTNRTVGAKVFLALMKNEPAQILDTYVFSYLALNGTGEFYAYASERYSQNPHPLILDFMIHAKHLLCKENPHDPAHLQDLQKLTDRYLSEGIERENILPALGYLAFQKGETEAAKDIYLEALLLYGPKAEHITPLSAAYEKLGHFDMAVKLLLDTSKRNKSLPILNATEEALIKYSLHEALLTFYSENLILMPAYMQKFTSLIDQIYESNKDKSAKEISELSYNIAILLLKMRIQRNVDPVRAQCYLSLCHFKSGNKPESIKVFKELYARSSTLTCNYLFPFLPEHTDYVCLVIPCIPKNDPLYNQLAMKAYFLNREYVKVLEPALALMHSFPDDSAPYLKRLMSFYHLGNGLGTLHLIEMMEERGWMTEELKEIKAEMEKKAAASNPVTPDKPIPSKKEKVREAPALPVDPFKLEKKDISDAKKAHLEREKHRIAAEAPAAHSGSKSVKGSVDPIEHKKRFNPLDFKPKEDEPEEARVPAAALKPVPKEAPPALFEISLNPVQKEKVVFAMERLTALIQLEKQEIDPPLKSAIHFRNHLYTYVKVFGILSDLAKPPLKDALYSKRSEARHEFMVCSLSACENVLNHFKQIGLVSQMESWVKGGIINNLSISQFSLRDNIENRKFEQLNAPEKNGRRLAFMKEEIELLIKIKKAIPSKEDFEKEGPYQIALKMSVMMLGVTWKNLNPVMKAQLAPHFRVLNLEGNKGAHNIKGETRHHQVTFKLGFDDISLDSLWEFAQTADTLKAVLIGIN